MVKKEKQKQNKNFIFLNKLMNLLDIKLLEW